MHLQNSFFDGVDNYPTTVLEAYNILHLQRKENPYQVQENDGVSFAQNGQKKDLSNIWCYSCNQMGHYANSPECPNYDPSKDKKKDGGGGPSRGEGANALMFTFLNLIMVSLTHKSFWIASQWWRYFQLSLLQNIQRMSEHENPLQYMDTGY